MIRESKLNLPKLFDKIYKLKKARKEPPVFEFEIYKEQLEELKSQYKTNSAIYQWLAMGKWSDES